MPQPGDLISSADTAAARSAIAPYVKRTPLLPTHQGPWIKVESLHPNGAFKIRGAFNALLALTPEERARGVLAPSSGNHAQAVAYAAKRLGAPCTVVMPNTSPQMKRDGVARWGAGLEIIDPLTGVNVNEWAKANAERLGLTIVPPFDSLRIIAGTSTIGAEILEDAEDLAAIYAPVSGGGLLSGVAAAVKAANPKLRVIGVEPELANDAFQSFRSGVRVEMPFRDTARTMADGLRVQRVGEWTFPHIQAFVDDIILVSEAEIAAAVAWIAREARLVAEPSGAVAIAGALKHAKDPTRAAAILSGGNVDPALYARLVAPA